MKRVQIGIAAACASIVAMPAAAFAEGESETAVSGADLLIPKAAEFIPALVIFLIILAILGKFVWPKVMAALDEREQNIQDDIDQAGELKKLAEEAKAEAERLVIEAHRKASEIVLEARKDAENERNKILASAHAEGEQIVADARERAAKEQRLMYDHATDSIAKVSVAVASKIVDEKLSCDEELQRKVIKKYLAEVGSYNG